MKQRTAQEWADFTGCPVTINKNGMSKYTTEDFPYIPGDASYWDSQGCDVLIPKGLITWPEGLDWKDSLTMPTVEMKEGDRCITWGKDSSDEHMAYNAIFIEKILKNKTVKVSYGSVIDIVGYAIPYEGNEELLWKPIGEWRWRFER